MNIFYLNNSSNIQWMHEGLRLSSTLLKLNDTTSFYVRFLKAASRGDSFLGYARCLRFATVSQQRGY